MNGTEYLLDTNIVIGLLKEHPTTMELLRQFPGILEGISISQITRMELLSFPEIRATEEQQILRFIENCTVLTLNYGIEIKTIELRRKYRLKLPDTIILATAVVHHQVLITLDQQLNAIFNQLWTIT
ncbi:type II toxin-antitoxin system VapC family toxin [Deltaproteobacteria bacterium TL4]